MTFLKNGNWGLKILALVLAIVVYILLKDESSKNATVHDRNFLQQR